MFLNGEVMIKLIIWKPGQTIPRVGYFNDNLISAIRIGRSTDNEIIIIDSQVSRFHAHIKFGTRMLTLVDLSSTNGTYLKRANSTHQIIAEQLINGDKVLIADYMIELVSDADSPTSNNVLATKLIIDDTSSSTDPNYKIMDRPYPSQHSTPILTPSKHSLRQLINLILATDSELDAFCLDNFAEVKRIFTISMDRISKVNILLEKEQPQIIAMYLREFNPEQYEKHKSKLQFAARSKYAPP